MHWVRLFQLVIDFDLSDSGTLFFSMVQHCVENKKSTYNCVNTHKIAMLQWKISRYLPQLKFSKYVAYGTYNAFELICRNIAWSPAVFLFMLAQSLQYCPPQSER